MTEKEKAIEDETIEVSAESTEKKTKKPHRRRAIVITVVVLALLTAGGIAWKAHADRLMAEARADCAAASERLRTATNDWNTLLNGSAADTVIQVPVVWRIAPSQSNIKPVDSVSLSGPFHEHPWDGPFLSPARMSKPESVKPGCNGIGRGSQFPPRHSQVQNL